MYIVSHPSRSIECIVQNYILQIIGPPSTPCCLNLGLVNKTSDSITVIFKSGSNGGATQTFHLEYKESSQSWPQAKVDVIPDPGFGQEIIWVIPDLKPLTKYDFRVKSDNIFGQSQYGNILVAETDVTKGM